MRLRLRLAAVMPLAVLTFAYGVSFGQTAHPSANGSEPCRTNDLRIRLGSSGGAGGEQGQAVIFTDTARIACAVSGFPKFSASTAAGHQVRVLLVTQTYLAGHPVKVVRLGSGESASILYDWPDAPSSRPGGGCLEVVKIMVGVRQGREGAASRTLHAHDDVCQGAINLLPFTAGSNPFGFPA